MVAHQLQHLTHQPPLELARQRTVMLRVPWLSQRPTRPTLADARLPPDPADRLRAAYRARQFSSNASRNMALSNSVSANSHFKRLFLLQLLQLLASLTFMPHYCFR